MEVRQNSRGMVPGCRAGFTLLEMIIVLVLAGMFMVMSIPALRDNLIDDPLNGTARKLIGFLDNVREMAVREQQGYLLRIDLNENIIHFFPEAELKEVDLAAPTDRNQFTPKGEVRLRSIWQKNSMAQSGGVVELWVSRQGYVENTVLHLEDEGRDVLSLAIAPFLVQIEVHDGVYEPDQNLR